MAELFFIILYIALIIFLVGLFLYILWISLLIGSVGGFFVGVAKGFINYFSALIENLKLRK